MNKRKIAAPPDPLIVGAAALLSERTADARQILPRLRAEVERQMNTRRRPGVFLTRRLPPR
jgi:hypothetical protein